MPADGGTIELSFRARLDRLERDMDAARGKAAKAAGDMGEEMEQRLGSKFSAGAKKTLVAGGAAAGAAGGAAAIVGFMGAMERGQAKANLTASLGLTGADAAKAGEIAGNLYADNFGESVAGAGDAVAAVLQGGLAGIDAAASDIETITGKVMTLADVFKVDMGTAVTVVGTMLTNGLVPDANTALDQLTATMQRVPEALRGDILDTLEEYTPFFAQLGISGAEAMSALVRASAGGRIAIDKTGDALKELTIRAVDGSKLTHEALTDLGLDVGKIEQGFAAGGKSAQEAMTEIVTALDSVEDPVKRTQLGVALLGTPFEDLGTHALPTLKALGTTLGEVEGQAQQMVDTVGGTGAAKLETFKRSMEENVSKVAEKAIGVIEKLPGPAQTAVATLAGLAPVLAPLGPIVGALIPLLFGQATAHTAAGTAAAGSSGGFFAAAAGLWAVMAPVLAVVAALALIGLAVYLVIEHWDTIKRVTKETWDKLPGPVQTGIRIIVGVMTGGLSEVVILVVRNWDRIKSITITGVAAVVDTFLGMAELVTGLAAKAFGWVPGVGPKLRSAADAVAGFRDDVNTYLAGIRDKTVTVTMQYVTVYREGGERTYGGDSTAGISQFAAGGLFTRPTFGIFGEAGPELLLPLTDMDRTRQLLAEAGLLGESDVAYMGHSGEGSTAGGDSAGGRDIQVGPFYGVRQDDLPTEIPRRLRSALHLWDR